MKNYACFFSAGNLVRFVSTSFVSLIAMALFTLGHRKANVSSTIRGQRTEELIRARPWQIHPLVRRRPFDKQIEINDLFEVMKEDETKYRRNHYKSCGGTEIVAAHTTAYISLF